MYPMKALAVLGATVLGAGPLSNAGTAEDAPPTCLLAPDLAEIRNRCGGEQDDPGPVACAQLRALELVANGSHEEAKAVLVRELELSETAGARLIPVFQILAPMVTADEPTACFERQLQGILQVLSRPETFMTAQSYEFVVFFNQVVAFAPDSLTAKVAELLDPVTARTLRAAGETLAELIGSTSAGEKLKGAIEDNPLLLMMSPEWLSGRYASPDTPAPREATGAGPRTLDEVLELVAAGRLPEARKALAAAREAAADDPAREGELALNAGVAFGLVGQPEDAAVLLQQADELLASAPEDEETQRVRGLGAWFRSLAFEELGLSAESEAALEEARSRSDFLGKLLSGMSSPAPTSPSGDPDFQTVAQMFQAVSSQLFSPDRDLEDLGVTVAALEKALPWATASVDASESEAPPSYLETLMDVFDQIAQNRPEDSVRVVEDLQRHHPRYQNAAVLLLPVIQHWKAGRLAQAFDVCRRAIEILESEVEDFRVDETLIRFFGGKGFAFYQVAVELAGRLGRREEAFDYAERGRAWTMRRLLGSARPVRSAPEGTESDPRARELLKALGDLERDLRSASADEAERLRAELERHRRDYESWRLRHKLSDPDESDLAQAAPVTLERLRHLLRAEDALVAYFPGLGDGRDSVWPLWVWVADRDGVTAESLPMSTEAYREAACEIRALRWKGAPERARRSAAARGVVPLTGCGPGSEDPAVTLYRRFLEPVKDSLRGKRHLVVVPYGVLHSLPFAALRDPATGRYLVRDFTLSLAPSLSALDQLARRSGDARGEVLVLGDPETGLDELEGARREAKAVAGLLGTEPLLGADATEAAVLAGAGKLGLLHLAAHGEYVDGHPIFSRIVLGADEHHDGALAVHEVWDRLDLGGTQLVTLSGCETALGERTAGDEVIGLTQGFLVAGSRAVVSTLWPVDDKASARLAVAFYERLLSGLPAAEALRGAQLELIASRGHGAPYYWAGYTFSGDPGVRWQAAAR